MSNGLMRVIKTRMCQPKSSTTFSSPTPIHFSSQPSPSSAPTDASTSRCPASRFPLWQAVITVRVANRAFLDQRRARTEGTQHRNTAERPPRHAGPHRGDLGERRQRTTGPYRGFSGERRRRTKGPQLHHTEARCTRAIQVYHTTNLVILGYGRRHPNPIVLWYGRRRHLLVVI
jgi:hypothetical protein